MGPLQALRHVFLLARAHMARSHRALAIVRPKRTFLAQIHLPEAEIVAHEQTLEARIDFVVVEIVDGVDATAAVIYGPFQLN